MGTSFLKRTTSNGKLNKATGKITYRYPPRFNEVVRGTKIVGGGTDESKQNLAEKEV